LLKKPAKGGIPAMENKTIPKEAAKIVFFKPKDVKFAKYFG